MANPEPEVPDGSALCVECGLCCQGHLHDYAVLREDEVEHAFNLGMIVKRDLARGLSFNLPCPLLAGAACTVYPDRPSTCRGYACGLLKRYKASEIPLEKALSLVAEAKRLISVIESQLPDGTPIRAARDAWRARSLARQATGDAEEIRGAAGIHLSMTMLQFLLDRHFRAAHDQHAFEESSEGC